MPQASQQAYIHSFLLHLNHHLPRLLSSSSLNPDDSSKPSSSAHIQAAVDHLAAFIGKVDPREEIWKVFVDGIVLGRNGLGKDSAFLGSTGMGGSLVEGKGAGEEIARVVVAWVAAGGEKGE